MDCPNGDRRCGPTFSAKFFIALKIAEPVAALPMRPHFMLEREWLARIGLQRNIYTSDNAQ